MIWITDIRLPLDHEEGALKQVILKRLGIPVEELVDFNIYRRSVDARRRGRITLVYSVLVEVRNQGQILTKEADDHRIREAPDREYRLVTHAGNASGPRPLIVGTGPAGLFAGLVLAEMGFEPLLLERGKPVRERAADTFKFWREGVLHPESNVQFGEGGAGTFSDGKLYSRISDDAHRDQKVIRELINAGAPEEILYLNKPHIGTLRLIRILENIRKRSQDLGGEYRDQSRGIDLLVEEERVSGVKLADGKELMSPVVILAVGHSARDTFQLLVKRQVKIQPKPFSIGLRIEHPQSLIDRAQYGPQAGHPRLGAADYQLVQHGQQGRSVYTFCMCPGGTVLAAASEPETVVTNGMSQYRRNAPNANSAVVCEIFPRDLEGGALRGVAFQRTWERKAYQLGGGSYHAPAQLVGDFLAGRASTGGGEVEPSYQPGVTWTDLGECLPPPVAEALRVSIQAFDRKITGFAMPDAVLTGVETRTSSPIRIVREDNFQSVSMEGLYPAGEGAGYAGGILSSAVDGIKAGEAAARQLKGLQDGP